MLTLKMDMADHLQPEGEWCELPRGREQLNAEENVNENHAVVYPASEKSDSCFETEQIVDASSPQTIKTTPRPTTKKMVTLFLTLLNCYQDEIPSFAAISAP